MKHSKQIEIETKYRQVYWEKYQQQEIEKIKALIAQRKQQGKNSKKCSKKILEKINREPNIFTIFFYFLNYQKF